MDATTTLTMEEPTLLLASTKKARDEEQQSPRGEASTKRDHVADDDAFREVTLFIKTLNILYSRLPRTSKEATAIVSMSDLSFV